VAVIFCIEFGIGRRSNIASNAEQGSESIEPMAPSGTLKVGRARRFIREQSLKPRKRAREQQIVSLKHVDNHNYPRLTQTLNILPAVVLGDNRISTE